MWRVWNRFRCKPELGLWERSRGRTVLCGTREMRWTWMWRRGVRLRLRGLREMVLDPPQDATPAPNPPSLSVQVPSSPRPPLQHPALESSFGRNCEQPQAPVVDRTQYEKLTRGNLHDQCSQRGYRREESEEARKTQLASTDAPEAKRMPVGGGDSEWG